MSGCVASFSRADGRDSLARCDVSGLPLRCDTGVSPPARHWLCGGVTPPLHRVKLGNPHVRLGRTVSVGYCFFSPSLGVTSATREGDKITVVGEGVDTVALTTMLRRKMGHVELLALTAIGDQKKEERAADQVKVEDAGSVQPIVWPTYYGGGGAVVAQPPCSYYYMDVGERRYYDHNSACSIL
ncbi:hypothetical protein KSP40_PGU002881 [Platanthera guangdongensis]|uniref:Uncharacterized protein n=1 Tax=Platanthera guangdongensis TaxID=2320717 RepID=A0ABR2LFM7_9ASPA